MELTILHAANQENGDYEWVQHAQLSEKVGVTEVQREAIRNRDYSATLWDEADRALLMYLQQVVEKIKADDSVWREFRVYFSEGQVVDLTLLHGTYRTLSAINMNAETPIDEPASEQTYKILEGKQ